MAFTLRRPVATLSVIGVLAIGSRPARAGDASGEQAAGLPPAASANSPVTAPPSTPPAGKPLQLAVHYRGRIDGLEGYGAIRGADDTYYLNRLRLDATVTMTPWVRAFAQVQDAETMGLNEPGAVPATHVDRGDIRQAYVEFGRKGASGVAARIGRQELTFGEQRLIGGGDWNNTARSFDAAQLTVARSGFRAHVFAGAVVAALPYRLDRRRTDEALYGTHLVFDRLVRSAVVEPFAFVKTLDTVTSEAGRPGDGHVTTAGVRATGKIAGNVDYSVEHAWQWGARSDDVLRADAGHYRRGWSRPAWPLTPRFLGEFNHASGDRQSGDGRRQTFDQLYPTNHANYGIADVIGWRNMRNAMAGVELWPMRRLKLAADVHRLALASTQDGLYLDGGARRLLDRSADSTALATECDVQAALAITPRISISAGFGYLAAGEYLRHAAV